MAWLNRSTILYAGNDKWSIDPRVIILVNTPTQYSIMIQNVDVYDVEAAELLYSMTSPVPFKRMGFSEDGGFTVAVTGDGRTAAGNLWQNESALLEAARRFAPGH